MAVRLSPEEARRAMRASTLEGAFASASDNAAAPFLPLYGLSLGATSAHIGLLAALPNLLTNGLQVPWAVLTERLGRRNQVMLWGAVGSRVLWLPLVLLPWLGLGSLAVPALLVAVGLRAAVAGMVGPAWTSLMADLVPRRLRGMYFANRNIVANVSALSAIVLAGILVEAGGDPGGYQLVFGFAVLTGLIAGAYMRQMPDLPWEGRPTTAAQGRGSRRTWFGWLEDRNFNRYCSASFLWALAVNLPAPLFAVYYVTHLGGTPAGWGLVTAANVAATVLGQRYWGLLSQRFGEKQVMLVSGAGACLLPLLWLAAPSALWALAVNGLGGFVWAGYNLANFNLLLSLAPAVRRTTFVAIYNTIIGLGAALGPLIGGYLADLAGIPVVLLISGVSRFFALWVFSRRVEQRTRPMTAADFLPLWVKMWRQTGTRAVLARVRLSLRRPRPRRRQLDRLAPSPRRSLPNETSRDRPNGNDDQ
ncbi:MAG: MFS transporter [Firmicutes bacterium]|nr:MFS transporter [Bacillota bacterium]